MSLKQQAVRGLKWTTAASVVSAVTQLLQTFVLARLLTKNDFGLMALAMVFVGFTQIFADMGITNAIIHKKDITHSQLHTVFFVNIFIGAFLCLILFFVAPLVSLFYEHPELTNMIRWLSLIFIVQPFGQIYNALLRKELQFDAIAKRDMLIKIIGLCISVGLALWGFGVYSFVGAQLSMILLSVILLIILGRKLYCPKWHISRTDILPFISFSMYQAGNQLVAFTRGQFDILLIGKIMSIEWVGLYNMAKRVIDFPISIINPIVTQVSFPVMAKIQDETLRLKNVFLKSISSIVAFSFPIYAFIALFATAILKIAAGEQWLPAAPLMQILCIYAVIRAIGNPTGSLLLAKGLVRRAFWWDFACLFIMTPFLFLGIPFGITGITWGFTISYLVIIVPLWYFLVRPTIFCGLNEYLSQLFRPFCTAILLAILLLPIAIWINHSLVQLIAGGIIFLLAFMPVARYINPPFYAELKLQILEAWKKHIKFNNPIK